MVMPTLEYVFGYLRHEALVAVSDSRCNEQARVGEPLTLRVLAAMSGVLATTRTLKLLFCCSKFVSCHTRGHCLVTI